MSSCSSASTGGHAVTRRLRRCRTEQTRCYTSLVPTTKRRYTFTDTGDLEALLDAAGRRWPEVSNRKLLLLRLALEGGNALGLQPEARSRQHRADRMQTALKRLASLVDRDVLLSDHAWR